MLIIILISVLILFVSYILGILINESFIPANLRFKYSMPIGVIANIGILQCLYYPLQFMDLPIKWFSLVTILFFAIVIFLGVFKIEIIKRDLKKIRDNKLELLFALLIFIMFVIIYYYVDFPRRTDDLYFYIPYVINKVTTPSRAIGRIFYDFQGFYDLLAVIVNFSDKIIDAGSMQAILPIAIMTWVPSIIIYMIIPLTLFNIYHRLKQHYNKINIIYSVVLVVVYILSMYWFFQTPYIGNTFRRITISIIFELIYIYISVRNKRTAVVLSLSIISIISQTSTGFIFSAIIIYILLCFLGLTHSKEYITDLLIISIGPAIYMCILYHFLLLFVIGCYVLCLTFVLTKKGYILENLWNKLSLSVMLLLPIIFSVTIHLPFYDYSGDFDMSYFVIENFSFFDPHQFEGIVNLLDFHFTNIVEIVKSVFCVIFWYIIGYETYYCLKRDKIKFFGIANLIIFTTFFNPFVMGFVMDNITDVVYFRLYDLFFNFATIIFGITVAITYFEQKNIRIALMFILFICVIFEIPKNQTWYSMNYSNDFASHLNHADSLDVSVINELMDYAKEENNTTPIIASQIYSSGALTDRVLINVKDNIYKYDLSDDSDEAILQRVLYRNEPGLPEIKEDYLKACSLLRDKKVQYTVIDAQYNWELESGIGYCGEKIFEKENYRVFKMHYDWLQWSMPEEYVNEE
ncbi:hypothetical protein [Holdemania massiliensis]|uniref:hypothetical protein n=1 Tax=Holdemania massiliensis TaxID=1468449 RepID=UPI001F066B3B|nr:hypothetical protein [Holdemania massiliensis]MCH1940235.1 hypothetical protein [Holdemania massiliensis]